MRRSWITTAVLVVTVGLVAAACSATINGTPASHTSPRTSTAVTAFPSAAGANQAAVPVDVQRAPTQTTLGEAGHVDLCSTATFAVWRHGIRLSTANIEPFGQCIYDANAHSGIFPVAAYAVSTSQANSLGSLTVLSHVHGHLVEAVAGGDRQRCTREVRFADLAIVVESFAGASVTRRDSCWGVDVAVHLFAVNDTAARYRQMPAPDTGIASVDFCLALPAGRAAAILDVDSVFTRAGDFHTVCTWVSEQRELDVQAALTSAGYELPDPNVHLGGHSLIAKCITPTKCEVDAAQPSVVGSRRIPFLRVTVIDTSSTGKASSIRLAAERAAVAVLDAAKLP